PARASGRSKRRRPPKLKPSPPQPKQSQPRSPMSERPNRRKVRDGVVVSAAMDKTVAVTVVERVRHRTYGKTVQRTKKVYAHDEANDLRVGDRVRLAEARPLAKVRDWRVVEVRERDK